MQDRDDKRYCKSVRFVCEDESELEACKSKAIKLRIILLERQEKNMFCKLSSFNTRDKNKFTKEINDMWLEMTNEEIDLEFNSICCDKLFEGGNDITSLPVQHLGLASNSTLIEKNVESVELKTE